ncbi:helix-turn-helix domain-containing protein [Fusobacterium gonidiaformans]|uniref:helix-turn-helix domain-containing protein n=1 Tax=Fusobacterium gonidiaformans TaxID=849 RepID=UPI0023F09443|nr:helix-turn-helix transcriptional regulator [Fusobacterium gonidiaformans]
MDFREHLEALMKDPELKKEYEALELEYQIKRMLIDARIKKDLTQKELAELVGTKQANISRLENGNSNPSIKFLEKVANALGKKLQINFV